jgi:hypothetical protein
MRWEEHGSGNFMKTDLVGDLCRYPRILLNCISDKQEV